MAAPQYQLDAGTLPAPDLSVRLERGTMSPSAVSNADPIHPGEILMEELLIPLGISQKRLAEKTGLTREQISSIVRCKCSITAEIASCLARYFGTTEQFWLDLQSNYTLESTQASELC